MLLHACGGFPGASRGLQGPPGASRGLQGAPGLRSLQKPHAGWSMAGRGGGASGQAEACLHGKLFIPARSQQVNGES